MLRKNYRHKLKTQYEYEKDYENKDHNDMIEKRRFSFYQICQFSVDKKYAIRKIIYDENGDMVEFRENKLKKDIIDKFLKKSPKYKYTIYPTYELDVIGFPEAKEILLASSKILNEY